MRPDVVVVEQPALDHGSSLRQVGEDFLVQALAAQPAVEALDKPFGCGLPGAMSCQSIPVRFVHSNIARLVISVTLSLAIVAGLPHRAIRTSSSRAMRWPPIEVSTISARASRVESSTMRRIDVTPVSHPAITRVLG